MLGAARCQQDLYHAKQAAEEVIRLSPHRANLQALRNTLCPNERSWILTDHLDTVLHDMEDEEKAGNALVAIIGGVCFRFFNPQEKAITFLFSTRLLQS